MIDITKKYRTRDGRGVRLISDQGAPKYPIIGVIEGADYSDDWNSDGMYGQDECSKDLIEITLEVEK